MEEIQNPHSNWKIPWKKRSTMFAKRLVNFGLIHSKLFVFYRRLSKKRN